MSQWETVEKISLWQMQSYAAIVYFPIFTFSPGVTFKYRDLLPLSLCFAIVTFTSLLALYYFVKLPCEIGKKYEKL